MPKFDGTLKSRVSHFEWGRLRIAKGRPSGGPNLSHQSTDAILSQNLRYLIPEEQPHKWN